MDTLRFIVKNRRFLLFGLLLTLFSTFGQTSFLAVFTPYLQDNFQLSSGEIGMIYSAATLLSALTISYTGRWIDTVDLRLFTLSACGLFVLACLSMAITTSTVMLFVGYYLLRYTCQGLMSHISMVSMARYYSRRRGWALSIAALGYPLGDAFLPIGIASILPLCGFSGAWWRLLILALCVITPLLMLLLNDHEHRHRNYLESMRDTDRQLQGSTPKEVLQDWKFYLITIGVLSPGFINTGIFFQNAELIHSKNWPQYIYAASLSMYAIGNIFGSSLSGILIDTYKSTRILPFYLIPMLIGLVFLCLAAPVWAMYVFMLGIGLSQGSASVIVGAVWAELYGSKHLGTIRSWTSALKVLSTGISPILFGYLIDNRVQFSTILIACTFYTIFSIITLTMVSLKSNAMKKPVYGL